MIKHRYVPPKVRTVDDLFADNLLVTRTMLRVSRAQLERRTGISARIIERIEVKLKGRAARRPVTIGEVVVIAQALGVQPAELLKSRQVPDA